MAIQRERGVRVRNGVSEYSGGAVSRAFLCAAVLAILALIAFSSPLQAQDVSEDDSINNSGNTDVNTQVQSQDCDAIVNQFNDASAGGAVATQDAVAATAAEVNAPVNVVKSCVQAGGSDTEDSGNSDSDASETQTSREDDTEETTEDTTENTTSAAQQQYNASRESTNAEDSCAVKLDPKVTVSDRGEDTAVINVASDQAGKYRVSYNVEDNGSINISLPSADSSGDAIGGFSVQGDGSRIIELTEGSYTVTIEPTPADAEYTVEVSRCGASSSDPDDVMNNTYNDDKVLANTGGPTETSRLDSASAVLIPSGALILASGVALGLRLRNRQS